MTGEYVLSPVTRETNYEIFQTYYVNDDICYLRKSTINTQSLRQHKTNRIAAYPSVISRKTLPLIMIFAISTLLSQLIKDYLVQNNNPTFYQLQSQNRN